MIRRVEGLYAVTPELDTDSLFGKVTSALKGGASIVQYRNKSGDDALRARQAAGVARLCHEYRALFIVNDDAGLAKKVQADGVHLGRDDARVGNARSILGADRIIGVSCYNDIERAHAAAREGADYVAFGSFFPSATKPSAVRADKSLLREASAQLSLPIVAIGGIDEQNARELIEAGADAIAVVSALFDAPDTQAQARRFALLFEIPVMRETQA